MRKIYFLLFAGCLSLSVYATPLDLDPATVLADTMYEAADYTVPSYTEFLVAKNAAVKSATQANL